ncbi:cyclase family protein [Microbacterium esteraromaticum]|uniref:cyclase family protein n=1 Tax=Microbacterium esteraromaticum TaxID=57043 RepID=UPI001C97B323|nr:cyclase family protein [Microbacterium esteraromaticum]MBY6061978.1 cyclase family protein [Microbacterium esteraromaticum]
MLHDLTHPITDGMMVYPGDPTVSIRPGLTLDRDGVVVERVQMGSHTGTHIDAPAHTILGGRTMAEVTLDELVGDALILRVPTAQPNQPYTWGDLVVPGGIPDVVPAIVIIDTGWARHFGQQAALQHPHLDAATAAELWRRGMRLLAVDTLSPDATGAPTASFPVHEIVLGGDGLIVENIRGLTDLPARVRVGFFPLNLQGDGAPVRAVAFT